MNLGNGVKSMFRYLYLTSLLMFILCMPSIAQVTYQGDITSDKHAESNDNKSVSANVKLKFRVKPTVAIAIHDGTSWTNNSLFKGRTLPIVSKLSTEQGQYFTDHLMTAIATYSNTDFTIDFGKNEPTKFVHESGEAYGVVYFLFAFYIETGLLNFQSGEQMITTIDIGETNAKGNKGIEGFLGVGFFQPNSIDPSDRAGNYYGSLTVTVSAI